MWIKNERVLVARWCCCCRQWQCQDCWSASTLSNRHSILLSATSAFKDFSIGCANLVLSVPIAGWVECLVGSDVDCVLAAIFCQQIFPLPSQKRSGTLFWKAGNFKHCWVAKMMSAFCKRCPWLTASPKCNDSGALPLLHVTLNSWCLCQESRSSKVSWWKIGHCPRFAHEGQHHNLQNSGLEFQDGAHWD